MVGESVVFGPGFWGPIIATVSMLLIAGVGGLFILAGRKITPRKPSEEKLMTYGCGEIISPEESRPDSEQFFSPIRRVFGRFYRRVSPARGGELSTYLFWVVVGLLFVLLWVVVALVVV